MGEFFITCFLSSIEVKQKSFHIEEFFGSIFHKEKTSSNLKEKEENSIARLSFSNLDISISIGQSNDNSYYLNHLLNGKEDPIGTPFLDYRNRLSDTKILIYGHNSETVFTNFHLLENYLDPDFLKDHPFIILEDVDVKSVYQIFSVMIVTSDFQHMKLEFREGEYQEHLKWLKNESQINTNISVNPLDSILILQTCYYHPRNSYLLVIGKKVESS